MASIRGGVGGVRGADGDSGKDRHPQDRFHGGYGYPDRGGPDHELGDGVRGGLPGDPGADRQAVAHLPGPLGPGYGGKLAVLLPGAEAGERQPCGPHRQTEYRADHPAGVPAPGGALRGGPGVRDGAYRRGDPAHGGEKGRDAAV